MSIRILLQSLMNCMKHVQTFPISPFCEAKEQEIGMILWKYRYAMTETFSYSYKGV